MLLTVSFSLYLPTCGDATERYDASGYGWDDDDKLSQLQEPEARFLVVRHKLRPEDAAAVDDNDKEEKKSGSSKKKSKKPKQGELVAIVHFR